jgi:conjugative transfer region lipoprotein (TIGR03751 family)
MVLFRFLILALVTIASLTGCATSKDHILPQGGPSMKEVYDAHFEQTRQHDIQGARQRVGSRPDGGPSAHLAGWSSEAQTEIGQLFPRLPNPDLVMYVFPHLSADGHPVPGYATSFPMYESVQYALPGEMEGR